MRCTICGQPMTHYRLTGYRCHNERHSEMARELSNRIIIAYRDDRITEDEWDAWIDGHYIGAVDVIRKQIVGDA